MPCPCPPRERWYPPHLFELCQLIGAGSGCLPGAGMVAYTPWAGGFVTGGTVSPGPLLLSAGVGQDTTPFLAVTAPRPEEHPKLFWNTEGVRSSSFAWFERGVLIWGFSAEPQGLGWGFFCCCCSVFIFYFGLILELVWGLRAVSFAGLGWTVASAFLSPSPRALGGKGLVGFCLTSFLSTSQRGFVRLPLGGQWPSINIACRRDGGSEVAPAP